MGIKGLGKIVKPYAHEKTLDEFSGQTFGIDVSIYMYKFLYGKDHVGSFFNQVVLLRKHDITPVYVFDGKPPEEKEYELKDRREAEKSKKKRMEALDKNSREYKKMKFQQIRVTEEHNTDLKALFDVCGVPYLQAEGEADHLLAKMYRDGNIDAVVSNDFDLLPSGSGVLLVDLNNKNPVVSQYILTEVLDGLGLTLPQFTDFCILCGCDYTCTIPGVGPVTSKTLIKKYDTIDAIVASNPAKYGEEAIEDFKYTEARELLTNGDTSETTRLEMVMPVKLKKIKKFLLEKSNVKDADLTKEKKLKCFRPKKITMDNFFGATSVAPATNTTKVKKNSKVI